LAVPHGARVDPGSDQAPARRPRLLPQAWPRGDLHRKRLRRPRPAHRRLRPHRPALAGLGPGDVRGRHAARPRLINLQRPGMDPAPEIAAAWPAEAIAGGALVVDVREQVEWDAGHISGAVWIPLGEL